MINEDYKTASKLSALFAMIAYGIVTFSYGYDNKSIPYWLSIIALMQIFIIYNLAAIFILLYDYIKNKKEVKKNDQNN